jgi:hypothetical protein
MFLKALGEEITRSVNELKLLDFGKSKDFWIMTKNSRFQLA